MTAPTTKRVAIRAGARVVPINDVYAEVEHTGELRGTAYGYESGVPTVKLDDGREVLVRSTDCEVLP